MTTLPENLCDGCTHRIRPTVDESMVGIMRCSAFPEGIPTEIRWGEQGHFDIHPDQEGPDVFEPRGQYGHNVRKAWEDGRSTQG